MMHSTLGVEKAADSANWMDAVIAFAKPFRMPDFFLISGLFLARVIDRDWTGYLDRKVYHFAYFYVIWVTIQFLFKAPDLVHGMGFVGGVEQYLYLYIEPFGTLWFIYVLPLFFVVVKLLRNVSPLLVWPIAAIAQMAQVHTGFTVIDESCARFVYFYSGYLLSPHVFQFAAKAIERPRLAVSLLIVWAAFEAAVVYSGYSAFPGIGLALGFIGTLAVVALSTLLSTRNWARPIRYAGQNSLVVCLVFFLPMAATRAALLRFEPDFNLGVISLIVTAVAVVMPLVLFELVKETRFKVLFRRPAWARADYWRARSLVAAE
jgi:uncharacterized membrane protein YcfT